MDTSSCFLAVAKLFSMEDCARVLGQLQRKHIKRKIQWLKAQYALEDFLPKRQELEARKMALEAEEAYLEALLPNMPKSKEKERRTFQLFKVRKSLAYTHKRLDKVDGIAHVDLQVKVATLGQEVALYEDYMLCLELRKEELALVAQPLRQITSQVEEAPAEAGITEKDIKAEITAMLKELNAGQRLVIAPAHALPTRDTIPLTAPSLEVAA